MKFAKKPKDDKYIFLYDSAGVVDKLVFFSDLSVFVGEMGWVRDKDYPVVVVSVVGTNKLKVAECDLHSVVVINGYELIIEFSSFYQGGKLHS